MLARLFLLLCFFTPASAVICGVAEASDFSAWKERQSLMLAEGGDLARVRLPLATLSRLAPGLSDLRVSDDQGRELSWATIPHVTPAVEYADAAGLSMHLYPDKAELLFDGPGEGWLLCELLVESSRMHFSNEVRLSVADDTGGWRPLLEHLPLQRASSQAAARLALPELPHSKYRLEVLRSREGLPPITGLRLGCRHVAKLETLPLAVRVGALEAFAGETRLNLHFESCNLPLKALKLTIKDTVFRRKLRLLRREYVGEEVRETELASGLLQTWPGHEGAAIFSVGAVLPCADLVLVVENGESPALSIETIEALALPVDLVFQRPQNGRAYLYAGAPHMPLPRYDLAAMIGELVQRKDFKPVPALSFSTFEANPVHQPAPPLPGLPFLGAELDLKKWDQKRGLPVPAAGVYEVDFDDALLASGYPRFPALRLVQGSRQVPYLLDRCPSLRVVPLPCASEASPRPGVGLWRLSLPQQGLPVHALRLNFGNRLFVRNITVIEERFDGRGQPQRLLLASLSWSRASQEEPLTRLISLPHGSRAGTLLLELENGDNEALIPSAVEALLPVVRMRFRTDGAADLQILGGNPSAYEPRYDVSLVADQLMQAGVTRLYPGPVETPQAGEGGLPLAAGWLFWGAVVLVVGILLLLLAVLLPKVTMKA